METTLYFNVKKRGEKAGKTADFELRNGKNIVSLKEFAESIDEFLKFNRYEILEGHGKITQTAAKTRAIKAYKEFNKNQRIVSDFDQEIKRMQTEKRR